MKKTIRDLRKNLLQLLSEYPPVLGQLTLETKYLLKVLHFFERVISWHDIFAHKEKEKN